MKVIQVHQTSLVKFQTADLGIGRACAGMIPRADDKPLASAGGVWTKEDLDRYLANPDTFLPGTKKTISGLPGVGFVVARRASLPALEEVGRRNIYLNLQKPIESADLHDQTPNTPSVTMIVTLDEALQELLEEGLENRMRRYRECSHLIRAEVRNMNLSILVPDHLASSTVTSVFLPDGIHVDEFIDELDRQGYVVYPGKRHLHQQNMFQIANMGQIQAQDCRKFLQVLNNTLKQFSLKTESADQK